jgi:SAM-dependent methyltransferase
MIISRKQRARKLLSSRETLVQSDSFRQEWYYRIELLEGVFTSGKKFPNVILTRKILGNIEVKDQSCIDIGSMEGLIPTLLKRRGANRVVAYDRRTDLTDRVNLVKVAYEVDFHYFRGMSLNNLPLILKTKKFLPFDIVIFSGVLYHMFDPFAGLATVRGMVRNGGILLLETAAVIDNTMAMYFNAGGRFYPRTNYFMISLDALDYMLRLLRLKPLDAIYFKQGKKLPGGFQKCRVCIPSLAIAEPLGGKGDQWIKNNFQLDFNEFLCWEALENKKPIINYRTFNRNMTIREDTASVDIYETVINTPGYPIKEEDKILKLNDSF